MSWISSLFTKHSGNVHFVAILLVSIALVIGEQSIAKFTGQVVFTGIHYPFFQLRSVFERLGDIEDENAQLRLSLVESSTRVTLFEEAVKENARLRSILGFEPPPQFELIPARVISVSGSATPDLVVISKGLFDSIQVNQSVINDAGLVGRIVFFGRDFCSVQLLTDPANRIAVRVGESREMGIVRYSVSEGMILDNLPIQSTIQIGDDIISSGLGGIYPAGLKVATVKSVERPQEEPFCTVRLNPVVNFYSLEELFVLKSVTND